MVKRTTTLQCIGLGLASVAAVPLFRNSGPFRHPGWIPRGGEQDAVTEELTLDQKVQAAMKKLGIEMPPPPPPPPEMPPEDPTCFGGVCPLPKREKPKEELPPQPPPPIVDNVPVEVQKELQPPLPPPTVDNDTGSNIVDTVEEMSDPPPPRPISEEEEEVQPPPPPLVAKVDVDPSEAAGRLAEEFEVDRSLAWASLVATSIDDDSGKRCYDENAARLMIQQEIRMVESIKTDSPEVQQLASEGFDIFLSRRALAFAENNMDDARAILLADQADAEAEEEQIADPPPATEFKTVEVSSNFDPTKMATASDESETSEPEPTSKPARKEDVVFEATASTIQDLVLESPVPVLLDVYADWCGPCKALTPALEEMAMKSGGAFRLVKVNSDNEKAIASSALEVSALPTVFGVKDGEIQNSFQGMPRSEDAMKSFMMGLLMPGASYDPPLTSDDKENYAQLTAKLLKTAGAASFSFAARERLQDRLSTLLDTFASESGFLEAESAAQTIRALLTNLIQKPKELKYRNVNLQNKIIAAKVAKHSSAVALLKMIGFVPGTNGEEILTIGKGKTLLNIAPLSVARDTIDKWTDKIRFEVAKARRQQQDEEARQKLLASKDVDEYDDGYEEEYSEEVDPDACELNVRVGNKKRIHTVELRADDTLAKLIEKLPKEVREATDVQIVCVAKRLSLKTSDKAAMKRSFRELGLLPSASLVVSFSEDPDRHTDDLSSLKARADAHRRRKTGSHTMQSIGVYAKDDNAKGELIDGGGGVWYEHDVTDDEEEDNSEMPSPEGEGTEELSEGEYDYGMSEEDEE